MSPYNNKDLCLVFMTKENIKWGTVTQAALSLPSARVIELSLQNSALVSPPLGNHSYFSSESIVSAQVTDPIELYMLFWVCLFERGSQTWTLSWHCWIWIPTQSLMSYVTLYELWCGMMMRIPPTIDVWQWASCKRVCYDPRILITTIWHD